jgi:hypothetical protein
MAHPVTQNKGFSHGADAEELNELRAWFSSIIEKVTSFEVANDLIVERAGEHPHFVFGFASRKSHVESQNHLAGGFTRTVHYQSSFDSRNVYHRESARTGSTILTGFYSAEWTPQRLRANG